VELIILIVVVLSLAFYFLPCIIANARGTKSQGGIFVLTLLLGWTLIGWLLAAIWAVTESPAPDKDLDTV
jgi:hypothetical protein